VFEGDCEALLNLNDNLLNKLNDVDSLAETTIYK
jgi:hypothetical protein